MPATVTALNNGPLMVKGEVDVVDAQGKRLPREGEALYLCRCGASSKKPLCDGTHKKISFQA